MNIRSFPNCTLGTSHIWNFLPNTSVLAAEYNSQGGPLEITFQVLLVGNLFSVP